VISAKYVLPVPGPRRCCYLHLVLYATQLTTQGSPVLALWRQLLEGSFEAVRIPKRESQG